MSVFCLDYQPAVAQGAGIGRYTRDLAKAIVPLLGGDDTLRLFCCDFHHRLKSPPVSGAALKAIRFIPGALLQKAWTRFRAPAFDRFSGPADLFHFTNFVTRPVRSGKIALTIHDMSFERFPEFAEERNRAYLHANVGRSAEEADVIFADSEFSKNEIESLLPSTRGKTFSTLLGVSPDFAPASAQTVEEVRKKLGLVRPFILTVGTIEPRKNLLLLVDFWEKLAPSGVDLVISGAPGWRCEPIFERFAEAEKRFPNAFHWIRRAPDGALGALYTAAALFATTSHYEGFGLPPLEAMACGTPVLSSAGGSLPEVLGDAATIVRSADPDDWAEAASRMLALSPDERTEISRRGRARASLFTWEKCATETLAAYRSVLF